MEAETSQYPTASYHVVDRLPLPNGFSSNPRDAFGGDSGTKEVAYSGKNEFLFTASLLFGFSPSHFLSWHASKNILPCRLLF